MGGPEAQFVINGSSFVKFFCEAIAFPEHNVTWAYTNSTGFLLDSIITSNDADTEKYLINRDRNETAFGRLTVNNVTYEDRGTYTCTVNNGVGMVSSSGNLTVQGLFYIYNNNNK